MTTRYGTLSVVGDELWLVGGYDHRVNLTGRDLRVPLAAPISLGRWSEAATSRTGGDGCWSPRC